MKEFKYTINGNSYTVEIIKEDGAEVELTVNGTAYTVEVEEEIIELPKKITRPAAAPTKPTGEPVLGVKKNVSSGGAVKAPLPGVILEVCQSRRHSESWRQSSAARSHEDGKYHCQRPGRQSVGNQGRSWDDRSGRHRNDHDRLDVSIERQSLRCLLFATTHVP
jgi:hypothetical protein